MAPGRGTSGGKWDILAGAVLRDEPAHFTHIYRTLMTAARAEGIGADRLPDFLGLEQPDRLQLLLEFSNGLPEYHAMKNSTA